MTRSELVANEIFYELFDVYLSQRKSDLENLDAGKIDKMYGGLFSFYQSRSLEEKDGVIEFLKIVVADTASIILGGLAGATDLGELAEDFVVKYDDEEIQETLQDDFIARIQTQTKTNI